MTAWLVWSDGSARSGASVAKGGRCPGGWAAVVEHGSDGEVVRGREPDTTNVLMEFRAAIEGLRVTPRGAEVELFTDCTTLQRALYEWANGTLAKCKAKDVAVWREFASAVARRRVRLVLLEKRVRPAQHLRAHVIAGAQAREQASLLGATEVRRPGTNPAPDPGKLPRAERRELARREEERRRGLRTGYVRSLHKPLCSPVYGCVYGCVVAGYQPLRDVG